jgi:hypothetical protein
MTSITKFNGANENDVDVVTDAELAMAIAAVKAEIIGTTSDALDWLVELQAALSTDFLPPNVDDEHNQIQWTVGRYFQLS